MNINEAMQYAERAKGPDAARRAAPDPEFSYGVVNNLFIDRNILFAVQINRVLTTLA